MVDQVDNTMIFEVLKKVQATVNATALDVADLKSRMTSMEIHLAEQASQLAALNGRVDRLEERVSRIERRLDLADA